MYCEAARVLLAAVVLLAAFPAAALDPSRALTQYARATWRMEDGLPHNAVRALAQTRDGYLWLGTHAGLVRFDGVRFVTFHAGTSGLRDDEVRALAAAPDGTLWIGTSAGGLHRLVDGRVEPVDLGTGDRTINSLAVAPDGTVWAGSGGGVFALRGGKPGSVTAVDGLSGTFVHAIALDGDRTLAGTDRGLVSIRAGRATPVASDGGSPVRSLCVDARGRVVVGWKEEVRVYRWDAAGRALELVEQSRQPESWGWIAALHEDRDGGLWVGSYGGGLYRRAGGRTERISTEHGFPDYRAWAFLEDREASLWVGTRGGLVRLRDGAASTLSAEEGMSVDIARAVLEDRDGSIWVAGEGGLVRLAAGVRQVFTTGEGLPSPSVKAMFRDRDGRFWAGTERGIAELDTVRGRVVRTLLEGLPSPIVRSFLEDPEGRVWIGTVEGVALAEHGLGKGPIVSQAGLDGVARTSIEALLRDRRGGIWIGTLTSGAFRLGGGAVERFPLLDGAALGVRSFHEDEDGTLYAGTLGAGLFVRRPGGRFQRLTAADGLPDNGIWSIVPRGRHLWMSSDRGVFAVSRRALLDRLDGRSAAPLVDRVVGTQDGMKSSECNGGGTRAGLLSRDDRLWFPTTRGAVVIDPRRRDPSRVPPVPAVEEVVIDRHEAPRGAVVSVPAGSRDVEIHYTGLSYVDPGRIRFRYRLAGYDRGWIEAGTRRAALYAALPPGGYEFQVRAANGDAEMGDDEARLAVRVLPRLDQTLWFRALAVASVLSAGLFGHLRRSRRRRAREEELRSLVAERTEALQRANDRLAELAAHDGLTGLANHRRFSERLEAEWARGRRSGEALSVLLCDIDDFKAYNDTYGHPAGDDCLARVARAIAGTLKRRSDLPARCGGEEFAVILPSTGEEGAAEVAELVRAAVGALGIEHCSSRAARRVTVSVGWATGRPARGEPAHRRDLVAAADRALYAAKAGGRNRVARAAPARERDARGAAAE